MSSNLTQYLIPIMNDRVDRLELRKGTTLKELSPELYDLYHDALKSDDLMVMGTFLEKLDEKFADILYLKI